jgi:hypothetical protein
MVTAVGERIRLGLNILAGDIAGEGYPDCWMGDFYKFGGVGGGLRVASSFI